MGNSPLYFLKSNENVKRAVTLINLNFLSSLQVNSKRNIEQNKMYIQFLACNNYIHCAEDLVIKHIFFLFHQSDFFYLEIFLFPIIWLFVLLYIMLET